MESVRWWVGWLVGWLVGWWDVGGLVGWLRNVDVMEKRTALTQKLCLYGFNALIFYGFLIIFMHLSDMFLHGFQSELGNDSGSILAALFDTFRFSWGVIF